MKGEMGAEVREAALPEGERLSRRLALWYVRLLEERLEASGLAPGEQARLVRELLEAREREKGAP